MKTTLYFTRHFHKGLLGGLTLPDQVTFVDVDHAARWVKGIKANTKLPYRLVDYSFQKYERS